MQYASSKEDPIFKEVLANFIMLSQTEKGLGVIKSLITSLKSVQAQALIVSAIKDRAQSYIENLYSNYAFQMIIKQWPFTVTQPLFEQLLGKVQYYSLQQCSSNVVEALVLNAPEDYKLRYLNELIESPDLSSMTVTSNDDKPIRKLCSSEDDCYCKFRLQNYLN
jgi:hypothetical protein